MLPEGKRFDVVSESERLIVRPLQQNDYKNWLHEFNSRFPSRHRHDPGRIDMSECTEEWFLDLVDQHQKKAVSDIAHVFGVFHKSDGTHLGMVDFSTLARMHFQWARIGYTIHNQHWGNGYGKEAVQEALKIAYDDLDFHRIEAHIAVDNDVSFHLAESVGMKYECTRKGFILEDDGWTDHLVYYMNSHSRPTI